MNCHSGPKPELSVAEVLQVFLPEYLQTHALPVHHLKVLRRLQQCRCWELGWTLWSCQQCGRSHCSANGCGDRHCPSCQHQRTARWLDQQRAALLPVRYFHWVFTLPALVRPLALQNPKALYDLLFESASATLLQFGRERFCGAQIGLTAILHTWGQNLMHHPHLHFLVTGGGLTAQNTWAGPKQTRWLFPIDAVADLFRGKFCAGLLKLHATAKLQFHGELKALSHPSAWATLLRTLQGPRWNVFAKGSVAGPQAVLDYLGRYTHRVALSNGRLLVIDPAARTLTFSYKDYAHDGQIKPMTLSGHEFIRRLLLHVLPSGFTKIRHYAILGNNRRHKQVPLARIALESSPLRFQPKAETPAHSTLVPQSNRLACPYCQATKLRCMGRVNRSGKLTLFKLPLNAWLPLTDTS
jgi:hypothetical protein